MRKTDYYPLIYDYLLRGYFFLKQHEFWLALKDFESQEEVANIAENQYYKSIALCMYKREIEAKKAIKLAKTLYMQGIKMNDTYTDPYAKVYLSQINKALQKTYSKISTSL